MTSKFFRAARFFAPVALAAVTACSSDKVTAPPGSAPITQTEQDQLGEIFTDPALMTAILGSSEDVSNLVIFEALSTGIQSLGSVDIHVGPGTPLVNYIPGTNSSTPPFRADVGTGDNSFKAFAGQLVIELRSPQAPGMVHRMTWMGMIAINDLEDPTEIVIAGATRGPIGSIPSKLPSTPFSGEDYDYDEDNNDGAEAMYIKKVNGEYIVYGARSGQITISGSAFSGTKSCNFAGFAALEGLDDEIEINGCQISNGSMKGTFNFTGTQYGTSNDVVIPSTSFNLPATRIVLKVTVDESDFED